MTVNGQSASDTVTITVQVGGTICLTDPVAVHPAAGTYFLAILYQDTGPCSSTGPAVFFVDGQQAAQPVTFTDNPQVGINLDTFDVDCDGDLTVSDVLLIRRIVSGLNTLPQPVFPCDADVDNDGDVDATDALASLRKIAGLPSN